MLRSIACGTLFFLLVLGAGSCAPQDDSTGPDPSVSGAGDDKAGAKPSLVEVPGNLRDRIDAALKNVHSRTLSTDHSFWTIFHGILGMGIDKAELFDNRTGKTFNAVDYICQGIGPIRGLEYDTTPYGVDVRLMAGTGVGQGHQDQFVAEMTEWGLPPDKKFLVNGKTYTFQDFLNHSKMRVRVTGKEELSWSIVIVAKHFGTDISWTNSRGEKVKFEDMVAYELHAPIETSEVCGGTHRLFGLTWAYYWHMQRGGKKVGIWKDVEKKIEKCRDLAKKWQNRDGSFSTNYFKGPGKSRDVKLRIASSGHILEWLALALSDEELREPWMQDAANAVAVMILENASNDLDGGGMYHAAHGLYLYRARVFGTRPPTIPPYPGK